MNNVYDGQSHHDITSKLIHHDLTASVLYQSHLSTTSNAISSGENAQELGGIFALSPAAFKKRNTSSGTCPVCNKRFRNLLKHMVVHSENRAKSHKCKVCGKQYYSKNGLLCHLEIHSKVKPHKCSECDKFFSSRLSLKMHTTQRHTTYLCNFCGKSLSSSASLVRHIRTHTGSKPYVCDTCGMTYAYDNVLRDHKLIHTGEKPHICKICGACFRQRSGMKQHVQYVHEGRKDANCGICGQNFKRKVCLEQHIAARHSNNPSMFGPCPVCGRFYKTAFTLRRHVALHDRLFKCKICFKGFSNNEKLESHVKKYENDKPIQCTYCKRSFHVMSSAKRHALLHLRDNDSQEGVEIQKENEVEKTKQVVTVEISTEIGEESVVTLTEIREETDAEDWLDDGGSSCQKEHKIFEATINYPDASEDLIEHCLELDNKVETLVIVNVEEPRITDNKSDSFSAGGNQNFSLIADSNISNQILPVFESYCSDKKVLSAKTSSLKEDFPHQFREDPIREKHHKLQCRYLTKTSALNGDTGESNAICELENIAQILPDSQTGPSKAKRQGQLCICETCGKATMNLKLHQKTHVKKFASCEICKKSYSTQSMIYHMKTHKEKRFSCSTCGKKFVLKYLLVQHQTMHSGIAPFQCQYCPKKFRLSRHLVTHTRTHTGEKPYACKICGKKFGYTNARNDHERIHTGEKPHACESCDKRFTQRSSLRTHMAVHSKEKAYQCDVCGSKHARKQDFDKHLRIHKTKRQMFTCEKCDKEFTGKFNLRQHMKWHDKLSCSVCRLRFDTPQELGEHENQFKGKPPMSCGTCHRSYHCKGSLLSHIRTHTGPLKKFECEICLFGFSSRQALHDHEVKYYGQRPFTCLLCKRKFHVRSVAMKHALTHKQN